MISPNQESFDFHGNRTGILSVKPLKTEPQPVTTSLNELDATLIGNSPAMTELKRRIQVVALTLVSGILIRFSLRPLVTSIPVRPFWLTRRWCRASRLS
jgi:hypothetical protein